MSTQAFACYSPALDCPSSTLQSAQIAYTSGQYLLAAELAETGPSPTEIAFAARAQIAHAVTQEEGLCLECLVKAEATAQEAITRGTNSGQKPQKLAESYVQLAVAIGFHGRLLKPSEAQAEGLAEKGRAAIDRALELDPLNVWARAALGGWHLEIVQRAGPVLASVLYGATEQEGLKQFRSALVDDPDNLQLRYHYALSILALDQERFRDEALLSLIAGEKDPLKDAMNTFTRKRARTLVAALKAGSSDEIEKLVRKFQGYPDD